MVDRRDLPEQYRPVVSPLLGDRAGSHARRHEDTDDDGRSICENQRCVLEQKTRRGDCRFPALCCCPFGDPPQMLKFIRAQRDVVERILQHIEMPSFSDLLVRIIQLDEQPAGAGVLEVCPHSIQRPFPRETHSHCAYSGYLMSAS